MRNRISITGIILALLILFPTPALEWSDIRAYRGNIFYNTFFKDPIEKLIVLFPDGEFFYFTTQQEKVVNMDGWSCIAILKQSGRSIVDAIIVIHNHPLGMPRFSEGDMNFLRTLKSYGFKGAFLLYHQPSGRVITYED